MNKQFIITNFAAFALMLFLPTGCLLSTLIILFLFLFPFLRLCMFNTIIAAKLNKISEIASFCGHYFEKGT